ncbi:ROK family protein [Mesorhizobium sp. B1-1-5]|uniref:ROK family protein n=1 Tax=Mesorhizobium sp. B1-1-5 TaxID=2589979 RepID=UPI00112E2784|nr:ROK family protein [Mesorhizobium sp. B1-1-5]TPN90069.1 ROK family protein [Mesorhizobium sp. B1-1-5]
MPLSIGIDIGGTNLRAARISGAGEILERLSEKSAPDPQAVLSRIAGMVRRLDTSEVSAIGIGVPGRVDAHRRAVLSGGYVNLASVSLAQCLEDMAGKPVVIDNDCNMALVAEMALGAGRGHHDVAMFTIGTGIGGAVAQDRRIVRGRATAGQLGHITVDVNGEICACGRRGCVETTSSGTALGRHIARAGLRPDLSVDQLFARDAAGDIQARAILEAWATPLRAAIDNSVAMSVPASGKSTVSRGIADRTGWPLLALDTIKNPFLEALGGGDRAFNRTLGRASYQAIWSVVGEAPAGSTFIVDAWFGFQPRELLEDHLRNAGVEQTFEIWCHAPGEVLAERYGARLGQRPAGHPGAAYIPELIELARRAEPLRRGPLFDVDTTKPIDFDAIMAWLRAMMTGDV